MGIFSTSFFKMSRKRVDCAIQHTGLSLVEGDNFCYFVNDKGKWTGEVLPISVMEEYGLREWIELAENIVDKLKQSNHNI